VTALSCKPFRRPSLRRNACGSIAVEAVFILPMLTLLFVGVIDFSGAILARTELFNAVHAGMLYSMSYPNDLAGIQTAVQNASSKEAGAGNISVTATNACHCVGGAVTLPGNCTEANCVTGDDYQMLSVTATQSYQLMVAFPGLPSSITLTENASLRTTNQ
jgi:Flp pilus assembly protein TadG